MGMYTELVLNVSLTYGVSEEVVETLSRLVEGSDNWSTVPDHAFFRTPRFKWALSSGSFYFTPYSTSKFEKKYLSVRSDIKNYNNEFEHFLDWIAPFVSDYFGGYTRYEEAEHPTLIYFREGKVIRRNIGEVIRP
jgi:hypothetical protein